MAAEIPKKILAEIKGRYIGTIVSDEPPSLVDMCGEFDLDDNYVDAVLGISRRENWEKARMDCRRKADLALQQQTDEVIGDIISNFKRAMQGSLAERLLKYNVYTAQIDAQLEAKLMNGLLNAGQLIRLKELMLSEANALAKTAIAITQITLGSGGENARDEGGTIIHPAAAPALSRWNAGGKAIEETGTTLGPGEATEEEKHTIFEQLKNQKPKGEA